MSEFIRKTRKINYYHNKCKKYLRFDFGYRCAYCGLHEFESILAYNSFQIDHFRPKKSLLHYPILTIILIYFIHVVFVIADLVKAIDGMKACLIPVWIKLSVMNITSSQALIL